MFAGSPRRPARRGASLGVPATDDEEQEVMVTLSLPGRKRKLTGDGSVLRKKRSLGRFRECSA